MDDGTFDTLQRHYEALAPDARAWINALAADAKKAGVSFHTSGNRTRRRYEIMRALTVLAEGGNHEDEQVRGFLWPIVGDCALFPAVPVGQIVGSLDVHEATKFADLIDGRLVMACDDAGRPTLRPAA